MVLTLPEPHVANTFPGRVVEVPLPIKVDGLPKFEVNFIIDSRFCRRKLQYFVVWMGYDALKRSWEPATNLSHTSLPVETFHILFPSKPRHPTIAGSNIWYMC